LIASLPGPLANAADLSDIPSTVAKQIRRHEISPADVSLYVHAVAEPRPRLAFNAEIPRNPASTIKLLTTEAALDMLGPGYVWKTKAFIDGTLRDGRLDGNLFLKGYGDPNISPEDFWRFLWGIRERGVETVGGDVILDNSYFEPPAAKRGDFDGAANRAYNALPSALSINRQTTRIHMVQVGSGAEIRVFTDPPLANIDVQNRIKLVQAPCKSKYHKPALRVVEDGGQATLKLSGTFASKCGEASYPRLLLDPAAHAGNSFAALWREMGGRVEGVVREGTRSKAARLLHTMDSPPLEEVVRAINKRSDNLMSRTLFLTLGAKRIGAPGSLPKARQAVTDWLNARGLEIPGLVMDNGSGLSRNARISAEGMGRLLGYAYASPTMPELLSSLSIAGVDGTMRKRFKKGALAGRAHIKTGTIKGATGIAGYVLDKAGRRWIVVSLINNPRLQTWRGKAVENALLQWVYEEAGATPGGQARAASQAPTEPAPEAWFLQEKKVGG
ncbi:MAG: D-alanyl-D-alanine carboxypeptidase/D-alanyl-D-alanine-endopeptidase, partial [Pseudomonadota bacterium]|nr:D-alanyl-D-alanine carboxypeptidase/D-alanyl-D-alanine-endopeptidase [Pseudomonadota bacterium]